MTFYLSLLPSLGADAMEGESVLHRALDRYYKAVVHACSLKGAGETPSLSFYSIVANMSLVMDELWSLLLRQHRGGVDGLGGGHGKSTKSGRSAESKEARRARNLCEKFEKVRLALHWPVSLVLWSFPYTAS